MSLLLSIRSYSVTFLNTEIKARALVADVSTSLCHRNTQFVNFSTESIYTDMC